MTNKKLKIQKLSINSFTTSMSKIHIATIKGGVDHDPTPDDTGDGDNGGTGNNGGGTGGGGNSNLCTVGCGSSDQAHTCMNTY